MKRTLRTGLLALTLTLPAAFAQQTPALSGIIVSDEPLAENTRVGLHLVDSDNVWGAEILSSTPVGGTFRVTPPEVPSGELRPFRSGSVLLYGLYNEYRVAPDDVNVAVARFSVYVDKNANGRFDSLEDPFYVGIARVEEPLGFYTLLYVDKAATITASGVELTLQPGWNVYNVRFPGDDTIFSVDQGVTDIVLDVSLP